MVSCRDGLILIFGIGQSVLILKQGKHDQHHGQCGGYGKARSPVQSAHPGARRSRWGGLRWGLHFGLLRQLFEQPVEVAVALNLFRTRFGYISLYVVDLLHWF